MRAEIYQLYFYFILLFIYFGLIQAATDQTQYKMTCTQSYWIGFIFSMVEIKDAFLVVQYVSMVMHLVVNFLSGLYEPIRR